MINLFSEGPVTKKQIIEDIEKRLKMLEKQRKDLKKMREKITYICSYCDFEKENPSVVSEHENRCANKRHYEHMLEETEKYISKVDKNSFYAMSEIGDLKYVGFFLFEKRALLAFESEKEIYTDIEIKRHLDIIWEMYCDKNELFQE